MEKRERKKRKKKEIGNENKQIFKKLKKIDKTKNNPPQNCENFKIT